MMLEEGVVVSVHNDKATIEISRTAAEACARCGVCVSAGDFKKLLEVQAVPGLSAGSKVTLKVDTPSAYQGMVFLFLLPLLAFFLGCLIGERATFILSDSPNFRMGLFGVTFFTISLLATSLYDKYLRRKRFQPPVIISVEGFGLDEAKGG